MKQTFLHTKNVTLYALSAKSAEKVLSSLQQYCHVYGYPKSLLCENGREFCNEILKTFCQNNDITKEHVALGMLTTQYYGRALLKDQTGLETGRETIIIQSGLHASVFNISYSRNITFHMAIDTTPYQVLFGIKPQREVSQNKDTDAHSEDYLQEPEQLNTSQVPHV